MSLNSIQLPGFVVADLYKNSLIGVDKKESEKKNGYGTLTSYKFLGNNQQKITLIVRSADTFFLPEQHLTFIAKMLEACKINIGDVAIVNHASSPVTVSELKQQLTPKIIILFGIEPIEIKLPVNFPQFRIQAYDDCNYLYSPALDILNQGTEEGKLLKSKLWVCLRTLFAV